MQPENNVTDWTKIGEGYDKVADDIWEGGALYQDSIRLLDNVKGNVLDIGCGQGVFLEAVKKKYPEIISISGCDISNELIRRAKIRLPSGDFRVANALTLDGYDSDFFDHVFMICSLEHMVEHQEALNAAFRVLKRGGKIAISVPNKNWVLYERWKRNHVQFQPVDDYWFKPEELVGLIEQAGFSVEKVLGGWALFRGNRAIHTLENMAADVFTPLRRKMKNIGVRAAKG